MLESIFGKPESFFGPNVGSVHTSVPTQVSESAAPGPAGPVPDISSGSTFTDEGQAPSINPSDWLASLHPDVIETVEKPTPLSRAGAVGVMEVQPAAMPGLNTYHNIHGSVKFQKQNLEIFSNLTNFSIFDTSL